MGNSIFLVGFMGAGKSSVGRSLARLLGWDFVDLDEMIEEREGRKVPAIFEESGEAVFRAIESSLLTEVVTRRNSVVALGGGAWISAANRELISRNGLSVFLDASLETIQRRVDADGSRPLFSESESVSTLYDERLPFYRKASLSVRTDGREVEEIAHQILEETGLK